MTIKRENKLSPSLFSFFLRTSWEVFCIGSMSCPLRQRCWVLHNTDALRYSIYHPELRALCSHRPFPLSVSHCSKCSLLWDNCFRDHRVSPPFHVGNQTHDQMETLVSMRIWTSRGSGVFRQFCLSQENRDKQTKRTKICLPVRLLSVVF